MIPITTHALRRYIERVIGFPCRCKSDTDAIAVFEEKTGRAAIDVLDIMRADVEPKTPLSVLQNRTRRVIRGETARYIVDKGYVITCFTGEEFSEAAE